MATGDDTEEEDGGTTSTALVLAAIGGGAVLLWLLWHGGGKGWGGKGKGWGGQDKGGNGRGSRSDGREGDPVRRVHVHVLPDNGIELNGIKSDLETTLAQARSADYVNFTARGDAVAGWVSNVYYALTDAGVMLPIDDRHPPPPRFDSNGRPIGLLDLGGAAALSRFLDDERAKHPTKSPSRQ
jgi:hypothetical protein